MDEQMLERIKVKMQEVADAMKDFADTAQLVAQIDATKMPIVALMLMLKTGELGRTLADRLFEYSELMEDVKGMGTK